MRKQTLIRLSGPRDTKLLFFLWKWKLGTTKALSVKFFPGVAESTAYRRLWRLEKGGFITSRADKAGRKYVWHLGKRGYDVIRGHLPLHLEEDGYKSEHIGHDLVASAFHLGDWFLELPEGIRIFSEQQIRRFREKDYPEYISRSLHHTPDGYTFIPRGEGGKLIAFEAELNPKSKGEYYGLYNQYGRQDVNYVFWLAPKLTIAKRIWRYVEAGSHSEHKRHSFITYPQFLTKGWGAEIVCGTNEGLTMRQVMEKLAQNPLQTPAKPVASQAMLNVSKTPHKSKRCKFFEIGDFAK